MRPSARLPAGPRRLPQGPAATVALADGYGAMVAPGEQAGNHLRESPEPRDPPRPLMAREAAGRLRPASHLAGR